MRDEIVRLINNRNPELQFGVMQADLSLLLDGFSVPIPKKNYLVCRTLTLPAVFMTRTPDGSTKATDDTTPAIEGDHSHTASGSHLHTITGGPPSVTDLATHSHADEGSHWHNVLTPAELRPLKAADRVLVCLIRGQDPVIVDIVVEGDDI